MTHEQQVAYWKTNLVYIVVILAVWFAVSYLAGILVADALDASMRLGGFPLGFWFAQQGSIYVFLALIPYYVVRVNRLDREHDVHED
jgi:putative solute:sodium symporter small subunit